MNVWGTVVKYMITLDSDPIRDDIVANNKLLIQTKIYRIFAIHMCYCE